jgi:ATP-dependent helicase/nuclease subunit A
MSNRLLEDAEARRIARHEFGRPVVLRAGAGTGKTAALVARVVSWVTGEGWNRSVAALDDTASPSIIAGRTLQRLVAITFTEAASAEMADRIAAALHALGSGCAVTGMVLDELHPDAAHRARVLLPAVDQLEVRTIHAWCRNILVQHPLEARIHPKFEVDASGDGIAELVRDVVEGQLTDALADENGALVLGLLERGIGPADIETAVRKLVDAAVDFGNFSNNAFDNEHLDSFWLRARDAITTVVSHIGNALDGIRAPNATALLSGLVAFRDQLSPGASVARVQTDLDALLPDKLRAHLLKAWAGGKAGKAETGALAAVGPRLAPDALVVSNALRCIEGLDPEGYRLARMVIGPAVEAVQQRMVQQGLLGFSDLLVRAARLMKNRQVAASVRSRIDQLLVDEFQDTDPLQCDIIRAIALQGDPGQRPGLFLVGDPKQSIYGWRNADLRAYEGFVAEVIAEGGAEYGLIQNFRSTAQLLAEVDRCMVGLLRPSPGLQPAHESLIAARGLGPDVPAVEAWVSWPWSDGEPVLPASAESARLVEAQALAADLSRLGESGVCYSEVGVLFRSTTHLQVYQWALRDAGIPYEVTRDRNYFRRREVVEASAMIRAVLDPLDSLALVSFLRSAMVGVPDAALIPLWAEGFPAAWAELGKGGVETCEALIARAAQHTRALEPHVDQLDQIRSWADHLHIVVRQVDRLRTAFLELPADIWVEQLRSALLPDVLSAVAYQGVYRVANLEQLFRLLCGQIEDCGGNIQAVLRGLRDAIGQQREAEESRPSGKRSAVQLMTIHKSKGLAFGHTYLVDLHHRFLATTILGGTRVDGVYGMQLAGLWPPGFDRAWTRAKQVEEAERARLLYVAMTRARDRLVLMGAWPETLRGLERPKMILDLWGARQPALPQASSVCQRLGAMEDQVDIEGLRWVFPGKLGRVAPRQDVDASSVITGRLHATPSSRLTEAQHRQTRPWSMGPSAAGSDSVVSGRSSTGRSDALLVGIAVHTLLEDLAKGSSDTSDVALQAAVNKVSDQTVLSPAAWDRARHLRDTIAGGALLEHLRSIEVLGTEVPMLMSASEEGPVGAWTGSIDLIYRCPQTQKVVVADYKTDQVGSRSHSDVAAHHAPQGAIYTEAVQRALGLQERPVFEVWLIEVDQRVVVS